MLLITVSESMKIYDEEFMLLLRSGYPCKGLGAVVLQILNLHKTVCLCSTYPENWQRFSTGSEPLY